MFEIFRVFMSVLVIGEFSDDLIINWILQGQAYTFTAKGHIFILTGLGPFL